MPSVFQQRAEQAQQAHAKAAVAMHMIAAKRAALQRQKQIALRKQKPTPQAQQEKTLHQAAHQENLLEANMHERGPYGWYGNLYSDWQSILSTQKESSGVAEERLLSALNANMNQLQSLNAQIQKTFNAPSFSTAESIYNLQGTALQTAEGGLKTQEMTYLNELNAANSALSKMTVTNTSNGLMVNGVALSSVLTNLGFKTVPYGTKFATNEVVLPGVGSSASTSQYLPAGLSGGFGTWAFHPNQFNQILSGASQVNSLYSKVSSETTLLNTYINTSNAIVSSQNQLLQYTNPSAYQRSELYKDMGNIITNQGANLLSYYQKLGTSAENFVGSLKITQPSASSSVSTSLIFSTKPPALSKDYQTTSNPIITVTSGSSSSSTPKNANTSSLLNSLSSAQSSFFSGKGSAFGYVNYGGILGSLWNDLNSLRNTEFSWIGNLKNIAAAPPSTYIVTPAGAFSIALGQTPTLKELSDYNNGLYNSETLPPWEISTQVATIQAEVAAQKNPNGWIASMTNNPGALLSTSNGKIPANTPWQSLNALNTLQTLSTTQKISNAESKSNPYPAEAELFGLGILSSMEDIIANPEIAGYKYGWTSKQFLTQAGISGAEVGLMLAPVGGGILAANIATSGAAAAGLGLEAQLATRAYIGGTVGLGAGIGQAVLTGAKGINFAEDVGFGIGMGILMALTMSPSSTVLEEAAAGIEKSSIITGDIDATGMYLSKGSAELNAESLLKTVIPKFNRFGYYVGTEPYSVASDIGMHIMPASPSSMPTEDMLGIERGTYKIDTSITRTIKIGDNKPILSSDILRGEFTDSNKILFQMSKDLYSEEATQDLQAVLPKSEDIETSATGFKALRLNLKSDITNKPLFQEFFGGYNEENIDTELFANNEQVSVLKSGDRIFKINSNSQMMKQFVEMPEIGGRIGTPEEVEDALKALKSPTTMLKEPTEMDLLSPDMADYLSKTGWNTELANEENFNEYEIRNALLRKLYNAQKSALPDLSKTASEEVESTNGAGEAEAAMPKEEATPKSSAAAEQAIVSTRLPWSSTQSIAMQDFLESLRGVSFEDSTSSLAWAALLSGNAIKNALMFMQSNPANLNAKTEANVNTLKNGTTNILPSLILPKSTQKIIGKERIGLKTSLQTGLSTGKVQGVPHIPNINNPTFPPPYPPTKHHEEPAQLLFPIRTRLTKRTAIKAKKSYFAFPDLLNENEYQFATGKRAHALKITPQNAKVYNRMFSQSLGLNVLTQEQLQRKARKTKLTKKKKIF
jgi:hypothetical protein